MKKTHWAILTILFCMTGIGLLEAGWKPAEGKLMTRWGRDLKPDNVWQEYPRPQFVRKNWQNLNGLWDYAVLSKKSTAPDRYQGKILVPFCVESTLSGVHKKVNPEDRIWYRKTFDIPAKWKGDRILLNFEAVDWEASVWVNGVLCGTHQGAYDRFSFDITDYLKKDGPQECVVSVWDPSSFGSQARGKQQMPQEGIWYTPVSGIWQTVWMEAVPMKASLKEVRITTDIDTQTVTILPILSEPVHQRYDVDIAVLDSNKQIAQAKTRADRPVTIKIDNPKLWSPDTPFLYSVKMALVKPNQEGDTKQVIEELTSYFGMRKISLGDGPAGKYLYLNNKPLFHYGTLDQGWWPDGLHTPPSDEAMKYDIEMTKKMGFNMIRKHIKIEPDRWYYWCDKLGMLIWQDMPSGMVVEHGKEEGDLHYLLSIGGDEPDLNRRTETTAQFEWELRRMIDLHYNAPSIVIWVPFNEGWGQYDTCRINDWIKAYDPTRLVNAVSGWSLRPCGDVYDIHTYEKQLTVPKFQQDQATVIGEYGGIGYPIKEHLWNPDMHNWGYQTYKSADDLLDNYIHIFNQIVEMKKKGLSAAVYTQTTDVEGEVNGLMTYDREVIKMDPKKLSELHSVLYE